MTTPPAPPLPDDPAPPPPRLPAATLEVRVGLATDLSELTLPCCDPRVAVQVGDERWSLGAPIRVKPAGDVAGGSAYRIQAAALKDERQAHGVAERLTSLTGEASDVVFDAGGDLYRVRHGRFASRDAAEAGRRRLEALGIADAWVVREGERIARPGFDVSQADHRRRVPGRWLAATAPRDVGVPLGATRYRGRLLVHLNDRGKLNVINELPLEQYLRGVVPLEMGPELYPEPEALKAQAVAARTFTVRNLGEFSAEGYDICSTPRCQVYGGMKVEHPRSDRAVAETTGRVVLFDGLPAETFYSASCGGHTEDVDTVFPAKSGPYLRGVPCPEAGTVRLGGSGRPDAFPEALTRELLPALGWSAGSLAGRLEHLALLADLPVPRDELRSLERPELRRYLASVFDLAIDPRVFVPEPRRFETMGAVAWGEREATFAGFLSDSRLFDGEERLRADEAEALLYHLALYLGVLRRDPVRFLRLEPPRLEVRGAEAPVQLDLPQGLATFRRHGNGFEAAELELVPGDALELLFRRQELVAVVLPIEVAEPSFGRRSVESPWTHFRSDRQLLEAVQTRYPGFPYEGFDVLARGVSGRVSKLRLRGAGGRSMTVEGLAVRWTLGLPDTLFTSEEIDGGFRFSGRGWGHGVGLCQAGAFGMATRGYRYREILEHYYTGIEVGTLPGGAGGAEPPRLAKGSTRGSR